MHLNGIINRAKQQVLDEYAAALKLLLESKHLYQKTTINFDAIVERFRQQLVGSNPNGAKYFDEQLAEFGMQRLHPSTGGVAALPRGTLPQIAGTLILKNVKLYCFNCKSGEVYQPLWYVDAANELLKPRAYEAPIEVRLDKNFQLIFMVYQCQRCKGDPEGFLVRRSLHSLFLEGRSPIEHIDLPSYLPKKEARLFSDAVVAFNSGKILGGIFYLRAFIEQFARRQTQIDGRSTGDAIMEAYGKLLPDSLRSQMPSFKECYEKLSIPIHLAADDSAVFNEVRQEIEKHFDIRRVFSIAEQE